MSNKLSVPQNSILPKEVGEMTLNQLLAQDGVEIKKKDNKTLIKRVTPTETISMEIRTYDNGITYSQSKFSMPEKKMDLKDVAKQMKNEGKTQAEIADLLGTSQPYISKMINSD